ncbi:hypothetical protein QJS10_CPB04g00329 [Acorus calamus]|uniref:B30.2/SPRY domain-containing protein n=1 Tax=Acorus calamus TaxID=4465 RepID=A0AAV9F1G1_ACOCL|nr:hypothetical protein QJS10_CPB04g00329 [Acorus calamus]
MECLKATYGADDESIDDAPKEPQQCCVEDPKSETLIRDENPEQQQQQQSTIPKSEEMEEEEQEKHNSNNNGDTTTTTTTNDDEEFEESTPLKKHKSLSACLDPPQPAPAMKKPKKKSNNVWSKPTSRKGKKKIKSSNNNNHNNNGNHISNGSNHQNHTSVVPDMAWITSAPRVPDRLDDSPEQTICLSKVYKAEKVELSEDRMSAGSTKGYRMVRATRGVSDGAWYFEIKIVRLGETGHTRLGWATGKGDLQAPVGYDANSFGYRDIDGSKVHKALRERYGEDGYREGDVIGFYISLPEGNSFAPKPPQTVWIKGQRYLYTDEGKDNPPKVVPVWGIVVNGVGL